MLKNKLLLVLMLFCFENKIKANGFWEALREDPVRILDKKTNKYDYDIAILGLKVLDYPFQAFKQIFRLRKLITFEIPKIRFFGYKLKAWVFLPILTKTIYNRCKLINENKVIKKDNKDKEIIEKEKLGFFRFFNPFNFYNALFYKGIELTKQNKITKKLITVNNIINNNYINWLWSWAFISKKIDIEN